MISVRIRRGLLAAACAASWVGATSVAAEIYRWTDAEGRVHFTQRLDRVPPEHRDAARRGAAQEGPARVHTYTGTVDGSPPAARQPASRRYDREIEIPFVLQGSVMRVEAVVNDHLRVPFLIDTGASGVSIPAFYADRLGIRVRGDTPHQTLHTANGVVARPVVEISAIELGGVRVENLSATVNPTMQIGLLGGSFFNNFIYRVDAARSVITLRPNDAIRAGLSEDQWRERFEELRDPLERLDAYVRDHPHLDADEQERLAQRRVELEAQLEALEDHANRLGVPHKWR